MHGDDTEKDAFNNELMKSGYFTLGMAGNEADKIHIRLWLITVPDTSQTNAPGKRFCQYKFQTCKS